VVGIDPWKDRDGSRTHVDYLVTNAREWGVEDLVLGIQVGVPDTRFATSSFDYVYSTTALEMVRGMQGEEVYRQCLAEIFRVLRPGGVFALGEPMHHDVEIPADLFPLITSGEENWTDFFVTLDMTVTAFQSVGFEIIEADYAPDARSWWLEYARHDPYCKQDPTGEPRIIEVDDDRWLSFGFVIARKPERGA
jgi:SAM-dependent methyltransferase